jgi:hypothetical protein
MLTAGQFLPSKDVATTELNRRIMAWFKGPE